MDFIAYLTVFRSRLGLANVVLPLASLSSVPEHVLSRRLRGVLETRTPKNPVSPSTSHIFAYLVQKGLVGEQVRLKGRYVNLALRQDAGAWRAENSTGERLDVVDVFQADEWMADPDVRSTIGVPTAENAAEAIDFCIQLGLLAKEKGSWTGAGHLIAQLRQCETRRPAASKSPFALGFEASALMRQLFASDGLILRALVDFLPVRFSRDDIASVFSKVVRSAGEYAVRRRQPSTVVRGLGQLARALEDSAARSGLGKGKQGGKNTSRGRGPGVLEHRTAPRLEWLVDLGALRKAEDSKNAFVYETTADLQHLVRALDSDAVDAGSAALEYWRSAEIWSGIRAWVACSDARKSLIRAYQLLQRPVGPAPIADVVFLAAIYAPSLSIQDLRTELTAWASKDARVTLAGGRFTSALQSVHFREELLTSEAGQ